MKSVVPSCFGDRGTLYRPRDTYVDAEFDGEFIADVYFLFCVSLDDENLKKLKIISRKIFSGRKYYRTNFCLGLYKSRCTKCHGYYARAWDYARAHYNIVQQKNQPKNSFT